ncbi:MAG: V-type ATP synthase subunit I, partial [Treponema sp.]|nr:V-type ATP synthase subunit I [Treponema sp.]
MIRPRRMKYIKLTVHKNDINAVLEYLGKNEAVHFPDSQEGGDRPEIIRIEQNIDRLRNCAGYVGVRLSDEKEFLFIPGENEQNLAEELLQKCEKLKMSEINAEQEKQRVSETYNEAKVFSKLNAPYIDLAHLSYLSLRVGRLDPFKQTELREKMGERAVIIPLDTTGRFLAASSRKGRFSLDLELKKFSFEPIAIPEGYKGIPVDILSGLEQQLALLESELESIRQQKETIRNENHSDFEKYEASCLTALAIERIKSKFTSTANTYLLAGWTPQDMVEKITADISELSGGRVA